MGDVGDCGGAGLEGGGAAVSEEWEGGALGLGLTVGLARLR